MNFEETAAMFESSPLMVELAQIYESGDLSRFDSEAKRQHFVPQLVLRGFSTPASNDGIFQLDVDSQAVVQTGIRAVASRRYLYAAFEEDGTRNNRIEGFFAVVESHAGPALARLLEEPHALTNDDRATLSFFFALQTQRTPAAAARITETANAVLQTTVGSEFSDPVEFARRHRAFFGDDKSDAEIEEFRLETIRQVREGKVRVVDGGGAAFSTGINHAVQQALWIFEFDWTLLRCPGAFVTSDRAFAIHDPTPRYPWSTQGLLSSPKSETTIPLTADACLVLRPLGRDLSVQEIPPNHAEVVNLRTYGWADRYLFGASVERLEEIAEAAKGNAGDVVRPKPWCHVTFFDADPDDNSFADENRQRGRPPRLMHEGALHDYAVIEHGKPDPELQVRVDAAVENRERKRAGITDGSRPPGRIQTNVVHPLDVG